MSPFCFTLSTPLYKKGQKIGHHLIAAFNKKENAELAAQNLSFNLEDCLIETHLCKDEYLYLSTSVEKLFEINKDDENIYPHVLRGSGTKLQAINDYRRRMSFLRDTYINTHLWPTVVLNMGTMGVYKIPVLENGYLERDKYEYINKII